MEEISEWLEELRHSDSIIIVEGLKDKRALAKFGIKNMISLTKPLFQIVEEIAAKHKNAIILTDFDKKGKELYGRLKKGLTNHGVKVDMKFREFLQRHTKLSHIEGLDTYIQKIERR